MTLDEEKALGVLGLLVTFLIDIALIEAVLAVKVRQSESAPTSPFQYSLVTGNERQDSTRELGNRTKKRKFIPDHIGPELSTEGLYQGLSPFPASIGLNGLQYGREP